MIDALIMTGLGHHADRRGQSSRLARLAAATRAPGFRVALLDCGLMEWTATEGAELLRLAAPTVVVLDCAGLPRHEVAASAARVRAAAPAACLVATTVGPAAAERVLEDGDVAIALAADAYPAIGMLLQALAAGGEPASIPGLSVRGAAGPADAAGALAAGALTRAAPVLELSLEYGLLTGMLEVAADNGAPGRPSGREWRARDAAEIGAELEATMRATGVRRFVLVGLEASAPGAHAVPWFRQLGRELGRRELDVHLGLATTRSVLDPELLPALRASGVQTLVVGRDPWADDDTEPFRSAPLIELAREHRLQVYLERELFAGSHTLVELCQTLAFLRDYFMQCGGAYLLFGRGSGREFLLALRALAWPPSAAATTGAGLEQFQEHARSLYDRCLLPLYATFRTLLRYWMMLRRDSRERSLKLIDIQLPALIDRLRTPALDLIEWLALVAAAARSWHERQVVEAADEVVASIRAQLGQFARFARQHGMRRGLRYVATAPAGPIVVGAAGRAVPAPDHALTADMVRLYNHLPRTTVLARLGRLGRAGELSDLYAALASLETADSSAALSAPARIELPGEILR
ncbi:MAG: hypothetical protein U1E76_13195 [Planctomycetota bacterium]